MNWRTKIRKILWYWSTGSRLRGVKAARDNIKIMKKSTAYGVQLVLLGLESQEHIHYAMPLRVMGYDYATYKKQYNNNARQYKKQSAQQDARLDEHEFLSKMKKDRPSVAGRHDRDLLWRKSMGCSDIVTWDFRYSGRDGTVCQ